MGLPDNDLLDLLLWRKEPQAIGEIIDIPEAREVLAMMRLPRPLTT